ncbi:MAG: hypothetical protein LBR76_02450 [Oscillospiraceae bacterium]|nr:hypothetical protein [Oscillospiraceae bacterium]
MAMDNWDVGRGILDAPRTSPGGICRHPLPVEGGNVEYADGIPPKSIAGGKTPPCTG